MIVEIVKNVPGTVNYRYLREGQTVELEDAVAGSLIGDGYATEVVRSTPVEAAERAVGRPRVSRDTKR